MAALLPTADEVRALLEQALAPLREEISALRSERQEQALTLNEAAVELHVSRRTVQRWVASGILPAVKVGSVRRVRRADLTRIAG